MIFVYGHPDGIYAKIIEDSVNATTMDRVTTFEVQCHRFVLAEFNTHCVFARNSASSRAIPVRKTLAKITDFPAFPVELPAELKGMQGGHPLEGNALVRAQDFIEQQHGDTLRNVELYLKSFPNEDKLHKSVLNRYLEPFMWHKIIVTATSYENFFFQRDHRMAMPEIRVLAELMHAAYHDSTPQPLTRGQWHLPYISEVERTMYGTYDLREISTARVARVSVNNQDGVRSTSDDKDLYHRLTGQDVSDPMHASPLEHICTPDSSNVAMVDIKDPDYPGTILSTRRVPKLGKFVGFQQWRHVVEGRKGIVSYR